MSAEMLRKAAALMRDRARAANAGPWKWTEQTHNEWYGIQSEFDALGTMFDPSDAFHVASWHPAVALAVADWLDTAAWQWEQVDRDQEWPDSRKTTAHLEDDLAVARAYLGGAA